MPPPRPGMRSENVFVNTISLSYSLLSRHFEETASMLVASRSLLIHLGKHRQKAILLAIHFDVQRSDAPCSGAVNIRCRVRHFNSWSHESLVRTIHVGNVNPALNFKGDLLAIWRPGNATLRNITRD